MILVRPLHELILFLFIAIPFLDFAVIFVVVPFDLLQIVIGKLAILLFQFTFELHPFPFELIRVHGFLLLCEMALSQCSYRFGPAAWHCGEAAVRESLCLSSPEGGRGSV